MAVRTDAELKAFFETNDFPTQEEFADHIDSKAHVDKIPLVRDIGNNVTIVGSAGITTSLSGGVLTVTVPAGGYFSNMRVDVQVSDCTYAVGTTGGFKVKVDNTANSLSIGLNPTFYKRTGSGAVNSGNPLTNDFTINSNAFSDEDDLVGISSIVFPEVATDATEGGVIQF